MVVICDFRGDCHFKLFEEVRSMPVVAVRDVTTNWSRCCCVLDVGAVVEGWVLVFRDVFICVYRPSSKRKTQAQEQGKYLINYGSVYY